MTGSPTHSQEEVRRGTYLEDIMRMDRGVEIVPFFVILIVTAQDFDQGARSRGLLLKEGGIGIALPVRSRERYPCSEKPKRVFFHILKGLILSLTVQKPSSKKTKSSKDVMTENLRETSIPATPDKAERFSSTKVRGAILWWGEGGHRSYFWVKLCGPY